MLLDSLKYFHGHLRSCVNHRRHGHLRSLRVCRALSLSLSSSPLKRKSCPPANHSNRHILCTIHWACCETCVSLLLYSTLLLWPLLCFTRIMCVLQKSPSISPPCVKPFHCPHCNIYCIRSRRHLVSVHTASSRDVLCTNTRTSNYYETCDAFLTNWCWWFVFLFSYTRVVVGLRQRLCDDVLSRFVLERFPSFAEIFSIILFCIWVCFFAIFFCRRSWV